MTAAGADAGTTATLRALEPSVGDFVTLMKPRVMTIPLSRQSDSLSNTS